MIYNVNVNVAWETTGMVASRLQDCGEGLCGFGDSCGRRAISADVIRIENHVITVLNQTSTINCQLGG